MMSPGDPRAYQDVLNEQSQAAETSLEDRSLPELRRLAKARGLKSSGAREELLTLLRDGGETSSVESDPESDQ